MSRESLETLNTQTLIGMTSQRGTAWHYRAELQGAEPNHYSDFVPVGDVRRRLFDWTAETAPLRYDAPADVDTMTGISADGLPIRTYTDETRQVIHHSRSGHVFGIFKTGYERHQYAETLLDGLAAITTSDGLAVTDDSLGIGSAGLLREGGQAWVQIERPGTVHTAEGVDFRSSILACTSHDGSLATTYSAVQTIVVCDNTMAWALAEGRGTGRRFKVKHSRYSALKIEDAREALGILVDSSEQFARDVAALCAVPVSEPQFGRFLDAWAPVPKEDGRAKTMAQTRRAELTSLYRHDNRVSPWAGTAFGVLQGVNTWAHHMPHVRGADRAARNMGNALSGKTAQTDAHTLALLDKVLSA